MTISVRSLTIVLLLFCFAWGQTADARAARPNVLLIVTDDMAFSDWGAFGGEIKTPHIDELASEGVRMANYYVSPTCSPTRAMLMTGIDHHMVGLGTMAELLQPNQLGKPGYEGYLNNRAVTLSELLRDAGYATMIAGKWHLGEGPEQDPSRKGFDRSFVLLEGGTSHFGDEWMLYPNYTPVYRQDGQRVHLPPGFYSSNFYTDQIIEWLKAKRDDQPFFAYLAFTAPHDPLHVPEDRLSDYKGVYDDGYDALSERRMARMKALGIVPSHAVAAPRPAFIPGWTDLMPSEQERQARAMEIYAAMVGIIDDNVGRLVDALKMRREYENTLVIIFSDNGANGHTMTAYPGVSEAWLNRNSDNRPENLGNRGSRISVGPGWALAGMTPFRMFKTFITEGGMRSPLIIRGTVGARAGTIGHAIADVRDIMPTVLELAEIVPPPRYQGRDVLPVQGLSMVPFLQGHQEEVHPKDQVFGYELFGWHGVRQGPWKATWIGPPVGANKWQLFNLDLDPGETRDLAGDQPARLSKLKMLWKQYAAEVGLVLPEKPSFRPH